MKTKLTLDESLARLKEDSDIADNFTEELQDAFNELQEAVGLLFYRFDETIPRIASLSFIPQNLLTDTFELQWGPTFLTRYGKWLDTKAVYTEMSKYFKAQPVHSSCLFYLCLRYLDKETWAKAEEYIKLREELGIHDENLNNYFDYWTDTYMLRYMDLFTSVGGLLRINTGAAVTDKRFYCVLPDDYLSRSQYNSLYDIYLAGYEAGRLVSGTIVYFVKVNGLTQSIRKKAIKTAKEVKRLFDAISYYYRNGVILEAKEEVEEESTEDVKVELPEETNAINLTDNAIATLLNSLIIDEFNAIDSYNSALATLADIDENSPIINIISDIIAEENVHIGQLQKALQTVSVAAEEINKGAVEAEDQLEEPVLEIETKDENKIEEALEDEDKWLIHIDDKYRHALETAESLVELKNAIQMLLNELKSKFEKHAAFDKPEEDGPVKELDELQAYLDNAEESADEYETIIDRIFDFCDNHFIYINL